MSDSTTNSSASGGAAATGAALNARFNLLRAEMNRGLVERTEEVDLALVALLSGENLLLVGPPGCAKSLLLDSILSAVTGATKFSLLMNKFTTPQEVFGPISLAALKVDRYARVTTGKLPEAHFFFGDELLKASTAILNTMLKILNERVYEEGGKSVKVPLRLAVAASNEWPDGKELGALFDRFLVRKSVAPVRSRGGRMRLLKGEVGPRITASLSLAELDAAAREARATPVTPEAYQAAADIVAACHAEGVVPSDRRLTRAMGVARASAWLNGSPAVLVDHLEVLSHVLWDDPVEQPAKVASIVNKVANPVGMRLAEAMLQVDDLVAATDTTKIASLMKAVEALKGVGEKWKHEVGEPSGRVRKFLDHVRGEFKRLKQSMVDASGI